MLSRSLLVALPLFLACACDLPTRAYVDAAANEIAAAKADERVTPLKQKIETLEARLAEAEKTSARVLTLETQFAGLSAQTVALEAELADAERRLGSLEEDAKKPTPTPSLHGRPDPEAYYKVEVGDAQAIGPADALVTIVTFSDFQCPFCKRVTPTIEQLRKDYGADLRYVFKHNPLAFHKEARVAAIAAEAAGEQEKFWEMHDLLFENPRALTRENFKKWAGQIKLDVKRFERDLDSAAIAKRVDAQQQQGVSLGARGTPSFFVNGRFLSGAQPAASFKTLIDEEMKKSR